MKPFLTIIKRELRAVSQERTIIIAIGIQLFIASFSSAILIGLLSFYDPSSIAENANVRIRVGILGDAGRVFTGYLEDAQIRPVRLGTVEQAERAFGSGAVDALFLFPSAPADTVNARLILPEGEARSTVTMMVLREPLRRYEDYLRGANGIVLDFAGLKGKYPTTYEFLYATIIPILMFFPGFVAGSMVIDTISAESEQSTLETLMSTPLSIAQIFGGKVTAALILATGQLALWLMVLSFNDVAIASPTLLFTLALVVAALNAFVAAIIATLFKDRERTQFVYSLMLVTGVGVSYLIGSSPLTLMTQLAIGDSFVGLADVIRYLVIAVMLGGVYLAGSRRLLDAKL